MDLVEIVKAYLNKETIEYTESDKMKALINLSIQQSLQPLLYPVFQEKSLLKYYIGWVVKQETFMSVQKLITQLFDDNDIPHIYFKGSVLCDLYDDPTVRTRGDIDLYVELKNIEKTKKIFLDNGFTFEDDQDCQHHLSFKKNGIEVELHFNMFDDDLPKVQLKFFKNPFELAQKKGNYLYEFTPTNHLIYCICHFAHHLRHGAGLRYILDYIYMFEKTSIDFDLLHEKLKELSMLKLYNNILNAMYVLTNKKYDNVEIIDIKFFIDYLLSYGIHGHSNNETTYQSSKGNKLKYFTSRVFLTNKGYRLSSYPRLGKHWYLYPICLIVHWCYLITHKLGGLFKLVFGRNHNKDIYGKLGI